VKLPNELREALDNTGLPWELELGGKHYKVKLAGRLVGVLPRGKFNGSHKRTLLNTVSQIRRAAQEIRNQ
jgi:hypothetical protein